MKDPLQDLFDTEAVWIRIYVGVESIADPFEKNVTAFILNPFSIKALVFDVADEKAQWIMPGIKFSKIKGMYVARRCLSLLENSQMIELKNSSGLMERFEGFRENGKMKIREEGGYLRVYIYSKHT